MKLAVVAGSHRQESQSQKVAQYLAKRFQSLDAGHTCYELDLGGNPLPLWDQGIWGEGSHWDQDWAPIAKELQSADAFVLVVPEWAGMVPAGMKNFLLLCTPKEVGHKPALIVSVSASRNGAYPVSELRMSGYKNNRICYIPDHIIVRDVASMLEGDQPSSDDDQYLRGRIDYSLKLLSSYAEGLKVVRESGVVDHKNYANGM